MNEEDKKKYHDKYLQAKQKGVKFFPDIIYKDLLVSFAIFLLLVGLATFVGVASEPKADPSDSTYVPRPEWYFLFLFEFLKYIPGSLEWVGAAVIPAAAVILLFVWPFIDRNPKRHWTKRKIEIGVMFVIVLGIIALTIMAVVSTPPQVEAAVAGSLTEKILLGQDLYSVNCVECHGDEGAGGSVQGVEGMEGVILKAINTRDEMYTRDDKSLFDIIDYGQQDLGMTPFGKGYGGALGPGDIDAVVTFMRYTWDDRSEIPAAVAAAGALPTLALGQVASYDVQVSAIFKRFCVSCHRSGKKNNNYLMGNYDEVINSGDNTPDIIAGDMTSNMMRMLNREKIDAGNPMPPTKPLKPELVAIIQNWIMNGMPQTAEQAAAITPVGAEGTSLAPAATATPAIVVTPTITNTLTGSETPAPTATLPRITVRLTLTPSPTGPTPTGQPPTATPTP